ncbi:glycosyltransferase family 2 protein, partial [bacterium]|nr:glycosyltransferase family 2 protein [bacterium]
VAHRGDGRECVERTLGMHADNVGGVHHEETFGAYHDEIVERCEVLVGDDGSQDDTAAVVAAAAERDPRVRLIRFEINRGKGAAVRAGMLAAAGTVILFCDADLSTSLDAIEPALAQVARGEADVVIGSRALPGSDLPLRQSWIREHLGQTFNRFVRAISRLPYRDTQCGFKLFSRAAAGQVFSRARIDGFAFDVEALVIARQQGLRISELPVRWVNSPDSRVGLLVHPAQMLRDLVRIGWWDRRGNPRR